MIELILIYSENAKNIFNYGVINRKTKTIAKYFQNFQKFTELKYFFIQFNFHKIECY